MTTGGHMTLILHNISKQPQQITPKAKYIMCKMNINKILKWDGKFIPLDHKKKRYEKLTFTKIKDIKLKVLKRRFPRVFDINPEAMKITPHMKKLSVGLQDVEWMTDIPLTSKTHYQAISTCELIEAEKFINLLMQQDIIREMKVEEKDILAKPYLFLNLIKRLG